MNFIIKILSKIGLGRLAGIVGRFIWNRVVKRAIKKQLKHNVVGSLDWLCGQVERAGWAVSEYGNKLAEELDLPDAYEEMVEPEFLRVPDAFTKGMKEQRG